MIVESAQDAPLVWFDIAIRGGAAADPPGLEGLHRHAATLARRGAGPLDRAALDDALDRMGAAIDVTAGRDATTVSALCLSRHVPKVMDLLIDVLTRPRWDADEHARLMRETPQVLDEVRDDDSALASRWFDAVVSPGHAYGRTALGTAASLARLELGAARALWQREVTRANVVLGIAGDVSPEQGAALLDRIAASLPDHPAPALPDLAGDSAPGAEVVLVDKADRTQAQLRLGHLGPAFGDPDTHALVLAEAAFGGMFSSRLMQELRVKRGWTYGAGCAWRRSRGPHWFEMWMATELGVCADAAKLATELLADLAARGPSTDELELARRYLVGSLPFSTATARQRVQLAVRDATFGLPAGYSVSVPTRLREVSAADVAAACARHLRPDRLRTVAVTTAGKTLDAFALAGLGPVRVVAFDAY